MNLLIETTEILKEHGKTWDNVFYIGTECTRVSVENFIAVANTEYDSGYGAPEVAQNLMIVGDDFWMTREDYDGSEWWEFHTKPRVPPMRFTEINALTIDQANEQGADVSCGWESLERMNSIEPD